MRGSPAVPPPASSPGNAPSSAGPGQMALGRRAGSQGVARTGSRALPAQLRPDPWGLGGGERIRRDANTRRHPSAVPRRFCACPPRPRRRPRLVEPGSRGGALAARAAGKRRSGPARPRGATPAWPLEVDAPQPPGCDDLGGGQAGRSRGGRAGARAPDGAEPAGDGCERGSRGAQSPSRGPR